MYRVVLINDVWTEREICHSKKSRLHPRLSRKLRVSDRDMDREVSTGYYGDEGTRMRWTIIFLSFVSTRVLPRFLVSLILLPNDTSEMGER